MKRLEDADADALVIGAGFFGCHVALQLRRMGMARVVLADRELGILRRASYANQARVHNGYHYPRSLGTATRSRQNFARFCADHPFAIAAGFEKIYAIARQSRVGASQFATFCARIGAPCQESPAHLRQLFDSNLIDAAFLTQEVAFDAAALAQDLLRRLDAAGVELRLGAAARLQAADAMGASVRLGGEAPALRLQLYLCGVGLSRRDFAQHAEKGTRRDRIDRAAADRLRDRSDRNGRAVLLGHALSGARLPFAQPCALHTARSLDRSCRGGDALAQPDDRDVARCRALHAAPRARPAPRFSFRDQGIVGA